MIHINFIEVSEHKYICRWVLCDAEGINSQNLTFVSKQPEHWVEAHLLRRRDKQG